MPTQEDLLFGKIAIKNRLVSEAQLKECLEILERRSGDKAGGSAGGNGERLGKVLLEKGYISASHFQAIAGRIRQVGAAQEAAAGQAAEERGAAAPASPARGKDRRRAPSGLGVHVDEIASRDYSHLWGQPLDAYLVEARRVGASDLHFQIDAPPFFRLHGQIIYLKHPVLTREYTKPRILEILGEFEREVFEKHNDVDFCYVAAHGRYRANVLRQRRGVDAVFRVIPDKIPMLADLHLPPVLERFTKYRQGIVLVTGPAGCGKTATMAALIDIINQEQYDHIVTVEDPIEYLIPSKNCNVNQRHVRVHTETFATALRSAMRADPDYICVGEMRDLETMSMAITAAETGHLVFGTLHTTNAVRSVDRLIDVFPPKEQEQIRAMVSESMRGVISQQLLPRADGRGREPALEIMFATPAVANMIREKKTFQLNSVLQTGSKLGMVTMDDSIRALLEEGLISRETAWFHAENKDRFK
jgi:twitching motility protein PilT